MTDGADRLEIGVLGPFEATAAGQPIVIRGATERALLCRLALDANRPVSIERIADDLWDDQAPRRPKQAIHALVFRLRQALGESAAALWTSDRGYCLGLEPDALDLQRFESLVILGRQARADGDLDAASGHLAMALGVWRGEALAGLGHYPFAGPAARGLEERRFEVLVERIDVDLARGLHTQLVPELEALALERPTHEGLCRLLMIALYRSGRQVDALACYDRLRKRLVRQFGIDPSPPLQDLEVELLRQDPQLDIPEPTVHPVQDPGPPQSESRQGSLPYPLTSFIGREAELTGVMALVGRYRMVTIAGPGGCGKTRLAIAAGHRLAAADDGEVRFVRLEGLTDPGLVPVAVAEALGIRLKTGPSAPAQPAGPAGQAEQSGPAGQAGQAGQAGISELARALADRDALVILDNCEHLLAACAALVATILESAAGVRFLLTSREQLGVPGEVVRRLRSLVAPDPGDPPEAIENAEAVRLFLDRAATALGTAETVSRSSGPLGRDALPAVAELCRRLDGIPLAIELAAARLVTLSLDQLSERLADRFGVLSTGPRTARPRHRTLLAAMTWSHDLLDEQERCLFRRLSVFASAFPLEAAETVCSGGPIDPRDVCDLLARLVGKSLVTVERDEGEVTYRLLSTIREYAGSWLTDQEERHQLARRHHDWYQAQAARAAATLHGGDQLRWARRVRAWIDDIRAALDWALGPEAESCTALAAQMWPVWDLWGMDREGSQWVARALARADEQAGQAQEQAGQAQEQAGQAQGQVSAEDLASLLLGAAVFARGADEYDQAHRFLDQSTTRYQELAHPAGIARCRLERGRLFVVECQFGPAEDCATDARHRYHEMADEWGVAWADVLAGNILMVRGEYAQAAEVFGAALAAGRRIANPAIIGDACVYLGLVAARSNEASGAKPYFEEALRIGRMLASDTLVNVSLANLGVVAGQEGDHHTALALLGEALTMARKRGEPLAVARILLESSEIASRQGEHLRSQGQAREALRVCRRIGTHSPVPQCLEVLARACLSRGEVARAATLLGAADHTRRELGLVTHALAADAPAQAQAQAHQDWQQAWQHGASLTMPEVIRFALTDS